MKNNLKKIIIGAISVLVLISGVFVYQNVINKDTASEWSQNPIPDYQPDDLGVRRGYVFDVIDGFGYSHLYNMKYEFLYKLKNDHKQLMVDYTMAMFYEAYFVVDDIYYFYCMLDDEPGTIYEIGVGTDCMIKSVRLLSDKEDIYKQSEFTELRYIDFYDGVTYTRKYQQNLEDVPADGVDPEQENQ
ncbi:MAG: hypothetical protein PHI41_08615 [Erysipelotrichaceae bacterium]|nr:hypothetical protein [Erysipelotrichaceae bacterium]